jgi:hypothetical protein
MRKYYKNELSYHNPKKKISEETIQNFFSALEVGDLDKIKEYEIDSNTFNLIDKNKNTPYHIILRNDSIADDVKLQIMEYMDSIGVPMDLPDSSNTWPIHIASKSMSEKIINFFVKKNVSLDRSDNLNNTPLHYSISGSKINCNITNIKPEPIIPEQSIDKTILNTSIADINNKILEIFKSDDTISKYIKSVIKTILKIKDTYGSSEIITDTINKIGKIFEDASYDESRDESDIDPFKKQKIKIKELIDMVYDKIKTESLRSAFDPLPIDVTTNKGWAIKIEGSDAHLISKTKEDIMTDATKENNKLVNEIDELSKSFKSIETDINTNKKQKVIQNYIDMLTNPSLGADAYLTSMLGFAGVQKVMCDLMNTRCLQHAFMWLDYKLSPENKNFENISLDNFYIIFADNIYIKPEKRLPKSATSWVSSTKINIEKNIPAIYPIIPGNNNTTDVQPRYMNIDDALPDLGKLFVPVTSIDYNNYENESREKYIQIIHDEYVEYIDNDTNKEKKIFKWLKNIFSREIFADIKKDVTQNLTKDLVTEIDKKTELSKEARIAKYISRTVYSLFINNKYSLSDIDMNNIRYLEEIIPLIKEKDYHYTEYEKILRDNNSGVDNIGEYEYYPIIRDKYGDIKDDNNNHIWTIYQYNISGNNPVPDFFRPNYNGNNGRGGPGRGGPGPNRGAPGPNPNRGGPGPNRGGPGPNRGGPGPNRGGPGSGRGAPDPNRGGPGSGRGGPGSGERIKNMPQLPSLSTVSLIGGVDEIFSFDEPIFMDEVKTDDKGRFGMTKEYKEKYYNLPSKYKSVYFLLYSSIINYNDQQKLIKDPKTFIDDYVASSATELFDPANELQNKELFGDNLPKSMEFLNKKKTEDDNDYTNRVKFFWSLPLEYRNIYSEAIELATKNSDINELYNNPKAYIDENMKNVLDERKQLKSLNYLNKKEIDKYILLSKEQKNAYWNIYNSLPEETKKNFLIDPDKYLTKKNIEISKNEIDKIINDNGYIISKEDNNYKKLADHWRKMVSIDDKIKLIKTVPYNFIGLYYDNNNNVKYLLPDMEEKLSQLKMISNTNFRVNIFPDIDIPLININKIKDESLIIKIINFNNSLNVSSSVNNNRPPQVSSELNIDNITIDDIINSTTLNRTLGDILNDNFYDRIDVKVDDIDLSLNYFDYFDSLISDIYEYNSNRILTDYFKYAKKNKLPKKEFDDDFKQISNASEQLLKVTGYNKIYNYGDILTAEDVFFKYNKKTKRMEKNKYGDNHITFGKFIDILSVVESIIMGSNYDNADTENSGKITAKNYTITNNSLPIDHNIIKIKRGRGSVEMNDDRMSNFFNKIDIDDIFKYNSKGILNKKKLDDAIGDVDMVNYPKFSNFKAAGYNKDIYYKYKLIYDIFSVCVRKTIYTIYKWYYYTLCREAPDAMLSKITSISDDDVLYEFLNPDNILGVMRPKLYKRINTNNFVNALSQINQKYNYPNLTENLDKKDNIFNFEDFTKIILNKFIVTTMKDKYKRINYSTTNYETEKIHHNRRKSFVNYLMNFLFSEPNRSVIGENGEDGYLFWIPKDERIKLLDIAKKNLSSAINNIYFEYYLKKYIGQPKKFKILFMTPFINKLLKNFDDKSKKKPPKTIIRIDALIMWIYTIFLSHYSYISYAVKKNSRNSQELLRKIKSLISNKKYYETYNYYMPMLYNVCMCIILWVNNYVASITNTFKKITDISKSFNFVTSNTIDTVYETENLQFDSILDIITTSNKYIIDESTDNLSLISAGKNIITGLGKFSVNYNSLIKYINNEMGIQIINSNISNPVTNIDQFFDNIIPPMNTDEFSKLINFVTIPDDFVKSYTYESDINYYDSTMATPPSVQIDTVNDVVMDIMPAAGDRDNFISGDDLVSVHGPILKKPNVPDGKEYLHGGNIGLVKTSFDYSNNWTEGAPLSIASELGTYIYVLRQYIVEMFVTYVVNNLASNPKLAELYKKIKEVGADNIDLNNKIYDKKVYAVFASRADVLLNKLFEYSFKESINDWVKSSYSKTEAKQTITNVLNSLDFVSENNYISLSLDKPLNLNIINSNYSRLAIPNIEMNIKYPIFDFNKNFIHHIYNLNFLSNTSTKNNKSCYYVNRKIIKKLLTADNIMKKNSEGDTPLHVATKMNNDKIIKLLINNGALYKNIRNMQKKTPVDIAIDNIIAHLNILQLDKTSVSDIMENLSSVFTHDIIKNVASDNKNNIVKHINAIIPIYMIMHNHMIFINVQNYRYGFSKSIKKYVDSIINEKYNSDSLSNFPIDLLPDNPDTYVNIFETNMVDNIYNESVKKSNMPKYNHLLEKLKELTVQKDGLASENASPTVTNAINAIQKEIDDIEKEKEKYVEKKIERKKISDTNINAYNNTIANIKQSERRDTLVEFYKKLFKDLKISEEDDNIVAGIWTHYIGNDISTTSSLIFVYLIKELNILVTKSEYDLTKNKNKTKFAEIFSFFKLYKKYLDKKNEYPKYISENPILDEEVDSAIYLINTIISPAVYNILMSQIYDYIVGINYVSLDKDQIQNKLDNFKKATYNGKSLRSYIFDKLSIVIYKFYNNVYLNKLDPEQKILSSDDIFDPIIEIITNNIEIEFEENNPLIKNINNALIPFINSTLKNVSYNLSYSLYGFQTYLLNIYQFMKTIKLFYNL